MHAISETVDLRKIVPTPILCIQNKTHPLQKILILLCIICNKTLRLLSTLPPFFSHKIYKPVNVMNYIIKLVALQSRDVLHVKLVCILYQSWCSDTHAAQVITSI